MSFSTIKRVSFINGSPSDSLLLSLITIYSLPFKDPYCWACHEEGNEVFCSKCGVGYHIHCANEMQENVCNLGLRKIFWIEECQQCQRIKASRNLFTGQNLRKFKKLSKELFNSTLKLILANCVRNKVK